jgi:hypothetical protein
MTDITVKSFEYYKLLGELNKLTLRIPKHVKTSFVPCGIRGIAYTTFTIDGLEGPDELYILLKYNGKVISEFIEVDPV